MISPTDRSLEHQRNELLMSVRRNVIALSLAASIGGLTMSSTAGAATTSPPQMGVRWTAPDGMRLDACEVRMQPYLGDYDLKFERHDGSVEQVHTATQEGGIPGEHNRWVIAPQTFTVTVGELDAVLWTSTNYRLPVDADSCAWADGFEYDAAYVNGKRMVDSVTIAPIWVPVPTTSTTVEVTTTTAFATTPLPSTTIPVEAATPTPESTTSLPVVTEATLPVTGVDSGDLARFAGFLGGVGMLAIAAADRWNRRRARRTAA